MGRNMVGIGLDRKIFRRIVGAGLIKSLTLSLAGVVDCAVVGHFLGADQLSAMKLAMPVFYILSLFSSILSTGLSLSVSQNLARGNKDTAIRTVRTVFTVTLLLSAIIMLFGILRPSALTTLLTADQVDQSVFEATTEYLTPILIAALPILLFDVLGTLTMIEGAQRFMRVASVLLLISDIIGDYIVVRLNLGLAGIASASAIAYFIAFIVIATYFIRGRSMFRLGVQAPDFKELHRVLFFGLPMMLKEICSILYPVSINFLMLRYGTISGLAALSIQDAVHYLPASLCSGIAGAVLIMTGIYAGERDNKGLENVQVYLLRWSLAGGAAIALLMGFSAVPLLRLFTPDPEILGLSVFALRFYLIGVPFLAINLATVSFLLGTKKNRSASAFMLLKHLLIPVSTALILGIPFGANGISISLGVCEIITSLILGLNLLLYRRRWKQEQQAEKNEELRKTIRDIEEAVSASKQINSFCIYHGVNERDAFLIALCSEEMAVNSIQHGFSDGRKHSLELRTVISDQRIILRLRDNCRRFDPVEWNKVMNPDDSTKNIGLRIVFGKAEDVSYSSALDLNNVCVIISTVTS